MGGPLFAAANTACCSSHEGSPGDAKIVSNNLLYVVYRISASAAVGMIALHADCRNRQSAVGGQLRFSEMVE
jgi:hypothetical protein